MNKKRVIAVFTAALMIALSLAGCGLFGLSTVGLVKKAADNLQKADSVKTEVTVDYEGSASYSFFSAPVTVNMDFDVETVMEPAVSHAVGTIEGSLFGISMDVPVESYSCKEDGENVAYVSVDGNKWVRYDQEGTGANDGSEMQFDSKAFIGLLQKISSGDIKAELAEETETICGQEAYKISVDVNGETLQELLEAVRESRDSKVELPEGFDLSGTGATMDLYIYKKSNLPAQVTIDCAALGNYVMKSFMEDSEVDVTTDKFEITVIFTEYDTIDSIEIPEEVISGAVDGENGGLFDSILPGM